MSVALIHLSDLHFATQPPGNPVMARTEQLLAAIRAHVSPSTQCAIVISGDIASHGSVDEYCLALEFIEHVHSGIAKYLTTVPPIVLVPGNHDLDFLDPTYDEQLRDSLIDSCSSTKPPTEQIHNILLKPQQNFRNFVYALKNSIPVIAACDLLGGDAMDVGKYKLRWHLLNTTRFSRKRDLPGQAWFPVRDLEQSLSVEADAKTTVSVAVMHHPWRWNSSDNQTEIRRSLEKHCDIIMTGHFHQPDALSQSRTSTEKNFYVEGGVLQDPDSEEICSFNILTINLEQQAFRCITMVLQEDEFAAGTADTEHKYIRLRSAQRNRFELSPDANLWLDEVGTGFVHPRARDLKLGELFVYPDLQRIDVQHSCKPSGLVSDKEVIGFLQDKRRVVIAGAEKSGKTSLAKGIFRDLASAGLVPIVVRADATFAGKKTDSIADRIRHSLSQEVAWIYGESARERFWGLKTEERAIIIDDYDKIALVSDGKDGLLRYLDEHFGIVIVVAALSMRMQDVLSRSRDEALLWTFEHVDILECDSEMRFHLAHRWLSAGRDPLELSKDELHSQCVRYHQVIGSLVGQGSIPSLPLFILMMMQQLESGHAVKGSAGLYGTLYDLIVGDVLRRSARKLTDVDVYVNYLSELAHCMHQRQKRHLTESEFFVWHDRYVDDYPHLQKNANDVINALSETGALRRDAEGIWFKYRYYFCYFYARFLADHIHEDAAIEEIAGLCRVLHNRDAADTMLFLCHRSKDPRVLEMILNSARRHFPEAAEYDLSEATPSGRLGASGSATLNLPVGSASERYQKDLHAQDEYGRPQGLTSSAESDVANGDETEDKEIRLMNEFASAFHTVRICGQVVRNFFGGMTGKQQTEFIDACYGVTLRTMARFLKLLQEERQEFAAAVREALIKRHPNCTSTEIEVRVSKSLHFMAMAVCYGTAKHCSNSVGLLDLKPCLDRMVSSGDCSITRRLVDLSTRLDYFDTFPADKVLSLHQCLPVVSLGRELLRLFVWDHFKQFDCEYDIRQRICDKLEIHYPGTVTFSAKRVWESQSALQLNVNQ